jgi:glutamate---cysteine ligase / carboxylate-amine ligase
MLAFRPRTRLAPPPQERGWAPPDAPWAVAITEQTMVLDPRRWELHDDLAPLLATLPPSLTRSVSATPDGTALQIRTGLQPTVRDAIAELGALRGRLTAALGRADLRAATAGSHPSAPQANTYALHVTVAITDFGRATLAHERLRGHLAVLLALGANSPFLGGRETGLCSARGDALEDPTADVGLIPERGSLEVRVLDAQTRLCDVAALTALVQCLTRHEATRPAKRTDRRTQLADVLTGRTHAARDGMRAQLPHGAAREMATKLIDAAVPHAVRLGCLAELERVRLIAARPGDVQQRARARLRPGETAGGRRLRALTAELSAAYVETV